MVDLNNTIVNMPSGWTPTAAIAINNSGVIAGIGYADLATSPPSGTEHAFVLNGGTLTEIPDPAPPTGTGIQPFGLNSSGEVVGDYLDSNYKEHAFMYTAGSARKRFWGWAEARRSPLRSTTRRRSLGGRPCRMAASAPFCIQMPTE